MLQLDLLPVLFPTSSEPPPSLMVLIEDVLSWQRLSFSAPSGGIFNFPHSIFVESTPSFPSLNLPLVRAPGTYPYGFERAPVVTSLARMGYHV